MLVMNVRAIAEKRVKLGFTGPHVRAFFLNLVRSVDEKLAEQLHNPPPPAPYAVKPVSKIVFKARKVRRLYGGELQIDVNDKVSFGFALLTSELVEKYSLDILNALFENEMVNIAGGEFLISEITVEKIDEVQKGDFERLLVKFQTPTFFRKKDSDYRDIFPTPRNVMTSVARIWKLLSGEDIDLDAIRELSEKKIGVIMYNLKSSRTIELGKGRKVVGFIGKCVYEAKDAEAVEVMNQFLKIGEITNIGGSRALGFGVIECIPVTKELSEKIISREQT